MSVLVFPEFLSPLKTLSLEEFKSAIREILANRIQEAWLYGSVARGDAGPQSDIDLFIVTETELPFHERGKLFDDLRDFNVNIEPFVYTPSEWRRLTESPSAGFWQSAVAEMQRII